MTSMLTRISITKQTLTSLYDREKELLGWKQAWVDFADLIEGLEIVQTP